MHICRNIRFQLKHGICMSQQHHPNMVSSHTVFTSTTTGGPPLPSLHIVQHKTLAKGQTPETVWVEHASLTKPQLAKTRDTRRERTCQTAEPGETVAASLCLDPGVGIASRCNVPRSVRRERTADAWIRSPGSPDLRDRATRQGAGHEYPSNTSLETWRRGALAWPWASGSTLSPLRQHPER